MGEEDDRHLWPYIAALVADLRPRWCLFENVAGHISLGLDGVLSDLEEIGYACWPVVVPACALNAPHRRDRVWIMAHAERGGRGEQLRTGAAQGPLPETVWGESASWFGSGGATVADAADGGVRRGGASWQPGLAAFGGEAVADSDGRRQQQRVPSQRGFSVIDQIGEGGIYGKTESRLGVPDDGLPRRLDERLARAWDGGWESGVPRVTDGCPDRANKLKALGNAIVPQVAYTLMAAMMEAA